MGASAYYAYSRGSTTIKPKERVSIMRDGAYNKVVFSSSGRVWHCINKDMLFDEQSRNDTFSIKRMNHNYSTYYDEHNPLNSDNTAYVYSDAQIKLLYAIDPYGVAAYVNRYAAYEIRTLEDMVAYKDRIFELLFGRQPKYFARDLSGNFYEVREFKELNDVMSESEVYFGGHMLYDWYTFFEILSVCTSVLNLVFSTSFFTNTVLGEGVKKIVTASLLATAGLESVLKKELANFANGYVVDKAFENTFKKAPILWAWQFVSLYDNLVSLVHAFNTDISYNKQIVDYCIHQTDYDVMVELKTGSQVLLSDICDLLD